MKARKADDPLTAETVGVEVSIYVPSGDGESGTLSRNTISLSHLIDMIDDYRTRKRDKDGQGITK